MKRVRLIVEPAQHLSYDDEVVDALLALTAGHPYYLHMLCGELALSVYNTGGTRVRPGHLESALDDWLPAQEEHHFSHLWGTDSAIDHRVQQYNKLFLTAVATAPSDVERWTPFDRLVRGPRARAHRRTGALARASNSIQDGHTRFRWRVGLSPEGRALPALDQYELFHLDNLRDIA